MLLASLVLWVCGEMIKFCLSWLTGGRSRHPGMQWMIWGGFTDCMTWAGLMGGRIVKNCGQERMTASNQTLTQGRLKTWASEDLFHQQTLHYAAFPIRKCQLESWARFSPQPPFSWALIISDKIFGFQSLCSFTFLGTSWSLPLKQANLQESVAIPAGNRKDVKRFLRTS